ncbi:DUF3037 domain-containing protein [Pedobacter frigoris]|uniref:DUF3037 domain-containing protein n=1 Tax=Pedobacter frigoris TaxID=2571272 RepID=A0A4U1CUW0_9SPHI|nr:DUF3037 domain-containing protein [Pedobacter frigoris]TKC09578.1 DUF3037 domain-containing protein [Pedobacter frigoris]
MQERHLFEYAVLRVMPHVEREEFINVGVILYCGRQRFLKVVFHLDENKLKTFCEKLDLDEIAANLMAFERICEGGRAGGPIGLLDIASRFRWLTATRSTVVQTSKVHPGFCDNPAEKLNKLYQQLVL